jgi:hypothetical protein
MCAAGSYWPLMADFVDKVAEAHRRAKHRRNLFAQNETGESQFHDLWIMGIACQCGVRVDARKTFINNIGHKRTHALQHIWTCTGRQNPGSPAVAFVTMQGQTRWRAAFDPSHLQRLEAAWRLKRGGLGKTMESWGVKN